MQTFTTLDRTFPFLTERHCVIQEDPNSICYTNSFCSFPAGELFSIERKLSQAKLVAAHANRELWYFSAVYFVTTDSTYNLSLTSHQFNDYDDDDDDGNNNNNNNNNNLTCLQFHLQYKNVRLKITRYAHEASTLGRELNYISSLGCKIALPNCSINATSSVEFEIYATRKPAL
jgi:hypothetical protein